MRKWLALALCTLLALSLCCLAAAEDLPEPFAHITFDGEDEGYTAITNGDKEAADEATLALLDGANKSIVPAEGVTFRYGEGPVGKALFLDGTYGIDLGIEPTNTDAWTVSFWLNASRLSDYGPTLQIGYNIGRNDQVANVTWMNVLYSCLVLLGMQAGRGLAAILLGTEPVVALGFITTDVLSYVFTVLIVRIVSRLDGMLEDQKHYLARVNEPRDPEGGVR